MSETENGQEKTEDPSAKRKRESREKGQVARSKDFNALVILLFSALGMLGLGSFISTQLTDMMREAFSFKKEGLTLVSLLFQQMYSLSLYGVWVLVPVLSLILFLSFAAPLLIGGWIFSAKALAPKFSRMNPGKGFKRMVSLKGLMEMIKSFLKFLVIVSATLGVFYWKVPQLLTLADYSLEIAIAKGLQTVTVSFLIVTSGLILIALVDVPFQIYSHRKELKMTKQEVKDEHKETEGRPEMKSQIRRVALEISQRRMMGALPKAQVVLTNPTHYAVALRYEKNGIRPPVVIAKGKDLMALHIGKLAKAHGIPLITLPPLTRALYFSTNINAEIPQGLYVAVAQVLAYVFQIDDSDTYETTPEILKNVHIPAELVRD